jgi:hypothetical protein
VPGSTDFCDDGLMRLIAILLAMLCHPALSAAAADVPADVARYLAGLPVAAAGPLRDLTAGGVWQDHSRRLGEAWSGFDRRLLSKLRTFAMNQLVDRRHTALYFFSGPDFVYAQALFPEASTYVLAGLEPADTFPAADPAELGELTLSRVRTSFETFFDFGLFVTVNMRGSRFAGVPELLAVQLALTGNAIDDVAFVAVEAGGHETSYSPAAGGAHGIRITFHDSAGVSKRLYYFSVDLSDTTIAPSGFLEFCRGLGPADVLLKNASFLLHGNSFSTVRKFLLEDAASVVQDDSGIPIRYFDGAAWSLRLFGAYRPPPESFSRYGQPELIDFEKRHPPEALDFPAGYYWWIRGSHLEIAVNKSRSAPPVQ